MEKLENLLHAIQLRKERERHSDFYVLLEQVNDRIHMFKSLFLQRKPKFIKEPTGARLSSQELVDRKAREAEDEKR